MNRLSMAALAVAIGLFSLLPTQPLGAQETRAYGQGVPFGLDALPPGRLHQDIERLPAPARDRALEWLSTFTFAEQDLPHIRADRRGGIFYEDPVFANVEAEEGGGSGPVLQEVTFSETFTLHSKPGASRTVYLDMDGHTVTGTVWNSNSGTDPLYMRPYDSNGNDAEFTQTELDAIAETWKRIAEDFAPYDIDVTTEEPTAFGPEVGHILVTPKADQNNNLIYNCSCGGVAYVGVWGESYYTNYQPALVFIDGVGTGPHNISEAASHELGHNLSLSHDGTASVGYYQGHGSGFTDWGPIMGVGYYAQISQWSQGEYAGANNLQDDLQIISGHLTYRNDDHADINFSLATPLTLTGGTSVLATNPVSDPGNGDPSNKGVIEHRSDVDLFYVDAGLGTVDLTVTPAWIASFASQSRRGVNLDVRATLYDSGGNPVAQSNPLDDTYAQVVANVGSGRYILAVEGIGVGDPLSNGYSDYGSLGQYFVNGSVPPAVVATSPPPAPSDLTAFVSGDVNIILNWSDPVSTLESNEAGYYVYRQVDGGTFVQIANRAPDSVTHADNNLDTGSYSYYVQPYNAAGSNLSNTTPAIELSVPVVANASTEATTSGSIQLGSYADTANDSGFERLAEQHQGGRPSRRVSKLEHVWTVTGVVSGAQVTLEVDADAPANSEGDDFDFAYSVNGGSYVDFDTLLNGTGRQVLTATLSPATSGTVRVRVADDDRTSGNGSTDSVDIYRIKITSSGATGDQPPVVSISSPQDGHQATEGDDVVFTASASDFEDDDLSAAITWRLDGDLVIGTGASATATLTVGTHAVTAEVTDSASNPGSDSVTVTVNPVGGGSDIVLDVAPTKRKGRHEPTLTWSGAVGSQVEIYRDNNLVDTTDNDGQHVNVIGNKGGATYTYVLCETEDGACSDPVAVVY